MIYFVKWNVFTYLILNLVGTISRLLVMKGLYRVISGRITQLRGILCCYKRTYVQGFFYDRTEGYLHYCIAVLLHNAPGQRTIRPHVLCPPDNGYFSFLVLSRSACAPSSPTAGKRFSANIVVKFLSRGRSPHANPRKIIILND